MNVYEETQLILHKYKIQANKSLGQNFLVDDNVIDEIIRSSNIDKQELIIEIMVEDVLNVQKVNTHHFQNK